MSERVAMRTWRGVGAVCAVVAGLALSACTEAPAPEPTPEVLSATQAGGTYLSAVCPVNDAWGELDVAVDKLRIAEGRGEGDAAVLSGAMTRLQGAIKTASQQLGDEAYVWPTEAQSDVAAVRETLLADAKQLKSFAKLSAGEAANYAWDAGSSAATSAAAREALGLPKNAEDACAQWAEAEAEAAAEKAAAEKEAEPEKPAEKSAN